MRKDGRAPDALRPVKVTRRFPSNAPGSVLIEMGNTKVLCTASVDRGVPDFLRGKGQGWLTAEYGMLPGSTETRKQFSLHDALKHMEGKRMLFKWPLPTSVAAVSVGIIDGEPRLDLDYPEDVTMDSTDPVSSEMATAWPAATPSAP